MMDFTVTFEPAPDEVARALRRGMRRRLSMYYLIFPSVMVVAALVCFLADVLISGGLGIGLILGIVMFIVAVVAPRATARAIRRTIRRHSSDICVPTAIRLTSDVYEYRTDEYTTTMKWSMFGRVVSTPQFWLFYNKRSRFAGFLPKRAFGNEQQTQLDDFFSARQTTNFSYTNKS